MTKRRGLPKPKPKYPQRCTCPDLGRRQFDYDCQYHGGRPGVRSLTRYQTAPPDRRRLAGDVPGLYQLNRSGNATSQREMARQLKTTRANLRRQLRSRTWQVVASA